MKSLGLSFDWSRQVNTADPEYYKWTQWIFIQLFKKGLAYQAKIPVNWCPKCLTGLANEEVVGGNCERCGTPVVRKEIKQWLLAITKYANRLLCDLDTVDFWEKIKTQQRAWIGKSVGAAIDFSVVGINEKITIFTTRPDTIFGVTALVLAPEHPLAAQLINYAANNKAITDYITQARQKSEFERLNLEKERTGIPLEEIWAINPVNGEKIPVWLGDYVIGSYGAGAVMMVPAHDRRDYDFAKKYNLPIKEVIAGGNITREAFVDYGILINSGQFSGLDSQTAIQKITEWLEKNNFGKKLLIINYATGYFRASIIGENQFQLSIVRNAARFLFPKISCR